MRNRILNTQIWLWSNCCF